MTYSIIHSTTYQVPVLYLSVEDITVASSGSLDAVYQHLVPRHQHEALRNVGILGGLGMIVSSGNL